MNREPLDELFEEVLREGNTDTLWALLDPDALSSPSENMALFSDPQLTEALDRFIETNRPSIATARSRSMLRRMLSRLKALLHKRMDSKTPATELPANVSLSAPETT